MFPTLQWLSKDFVKISPFLRIVTYLIFLLRLRYILTLKYVFNKSLLLGIFLYYVVECKEHPVILGFQNLI